MSSDDQFELEEKLGIVSLHPSTSSGHGVSDVDDEKSVHDDERVCPVEWTGSHRCRKLLRLLDQVTNSS